MKLTACTKLILGAVCVAELQPDTYWLHQEIPSNAVNLNDQPAGINTNNI